MLPLSRMSKVTISLTYFLCRLAYSQAAPADLLHTQSANVGAQHPTSPTFDDEELSPLLGAPADYTVTYLKQVYGTPIVSKSLEGHDDQLKQSADVAGITKKTEEQIAAQRKSVSNERLPSHTSKSKDGLSSMNLSDLTAVPLSPISTKLNSTSETRDTTTIYKTPY